MDMKNIKINIKPKSLAIKINKQSKPKTLSSGLWIKKFNKPVNKVLKKSDISLPDVAQTNLQLIIHSRK
jgi:hypothetical protein